MTTEKQYAVVITKPGRETVRFGPIPYHSQAQGWISTLDMNTGAARLEGTIWGIADYDPALPHTPARVPTGPYELTEAIDAEPAGDGLGTNFPDLFLRLQAQEGYDRASELWTKACEHMDYLVWFDERGEDV